jgi:hypothetical protein
MDFKAKSFPKWAFKYELCGSFTADGWKLVEITDEDKLESTEGTLAASNGTANSIQLLKEFRGQHGDFVNHQGICSTPSCGGATVHTDSFYENMSRSIAEANSCPAMKSSCAGV